MGSASIGLWLPPRLLPTHRPNLLLTCACSRFPLAPVADLCLRSWVRGLILTGGFWGKHFFFLLWRTRQSTDIAMGDASRKSAREDVFWHGIESLAYTIIYILLLSFLHINKGNELIQQRNFVSYSSTHGVDGVKKMMGEEHSKTFLLLPRRLPALCWSVTWRHFLSSGPPSGWYYSRRESLP